MHNVHSIVRRPIVTEKSSLLREVNKFTFEVDNRANKIEIAKAIEELFEVKVINVRTMNQRGKSKRLMRKGGVFSGKRRNWKKAIVTLKEGDDIEIIEGV